MEHKTLEAKATTTDLGEFTAIAAAYSTDRVGDRIVPGAFKASIARWQESGKKIPLHWDHQGAPEDIIGTVDPADMSEVDDGLEVKGQLDMESEIAQTVWRLMKRDAVGLSFGYLVQDSAEEDGVKLLKALDLFEVSITPAPANPDTRVLSMKAMLSDPEAVVLAPEAVVYGDELAGAQSGLLKAVWTLAYIDALPDDAFLYVAPGGVLDESERTTPRALRYYPFKDARGGLDEAHLRNATARIPHSDLPKSVQEELATKATGLLAEHTAVKDTPPAAKASPGKVHDPLREQSLELASQARLAGFSKPEPAAPEPQPEPPPTATEVKRRARQAMLAHLHSG